MNSRWEATKMIILLARPINLRYFLGLTGCAIDKSPGDYSAVSQYAAMVAMKMVFASCLVDRNAFVASGPPRVSWRKTWRAACDVRPTRCN